jgi:hypothetical protein
MELGILTRVPSMASKEDFQWLKELQTDPLRLFEKIVFQANTLHIVIISVETRLWNNISVWHRQQRLLV